MKVFALEYSGVGRIKQTIRKVVGVGGGDGYLTVGLRDMLPPARWDVSRVEITILWRAAIERERAALMARVAELDAMSNAGPIFQES